MDEFLEDLMMRLVDRIVNHQIRIKELEENLRDASECIREARMLLPGVERHFSCTSLADSIRNMAKLIESLTDRISSLQREKQNGSGEEAGVGGNGVEGGDRETEGGN